VLSAVGDGAAEVGGSVNVGKISFEEHVRVWASELEDDPRQLAVADQEVGTTTKEFVRDGVGIEQTEKVWDRFMPGDAEEVGSAADPK